MKRDEHFSEADLIEFAEGESSARLTANIEEHLRDCEPCRAHVESLRATLSALASDTVPEPPPGYWDYFEQRVRARATEKQGERRRHPVFALVPGLAAAAVFLLLLWWMPRTRSPEIYGVDVILADMTTGEIIETASGSPYAAAVLLDTGEGMAQIEAYLAETGDIHDLVESLSPAEMERFMKSLIESIDEDENHSRLDHRLEEGQDNGISRKGC
jgi:hypothetical protein